MKVTIVSHKHITKNNFTSVTLWHISTQCHLTHWIHLINNIKYNFFVSSVIFRLNKALGFSDNLSLLVTVLHISIKNSVFLSRVWRHEQKPADCLKFWTFSGSVVSSLCGGSGETATANSRCGFWTKPWHGRLFSLHRMILVFIKRRKALLAVVFHLQETASPSFCPFCLCVVPGLQLCGFQQVLLFRSMVEHKRWFRTATRLGWST